MRILFVAMSESIHTARWISQLNEPEWDIHLFPSKVVSWVNPELTHTTVHHTAYCTDYGTDSTVTHRGIRLWSPVEKDRASGIYQRVTNRLFPNYRVNTLCGLIRKLNPDIVHTLEFQNGGYLTVEAKKRLGDQFPPWILSSWGNDIYLFGRTGEHREKIKELLQLADFFISDTQRDIPLAVDLGINGEILGQVLAGGGYHLDQIPQFDTLLPPSKRNVILLKGYQSFAGRALFGLRALALCRDVLQDYEIVIYFPSNDVKLAAELLAHETGLTIRTFTSVPHVEWLRLLSTARINIGVSISDGTPLSMLESLLVGTFIIQSNTAAVDEWVTDGQTGSIVPPEDIHAIANAIRQAVTNDDLVDNAARINYEVAQARLDYDLIKSKVIDMYRYVATKPRAIKK